MLTNFPENLNQKLHLINLLSLFEMSSIFGTASVYRLIDSNNCGRMCRTSVADVCKKMPATLLTTVRTPLFVVRAPMTAVFKKIFSAQHSGSTVF